MLGQLIQGRAISLNDGGREGGDVRFVQTGRRSCFVPKERHGKRFSVARLAAILMVVILGFEFSVAVSLDVSFEFRLVSPLSHGSAESAATGAAHGSDAASKGVRASGSLRRSSARGA